MKKWVSCPYSYYTTFSRLPFTYDLKVNNVWSVDKGRENLNPVYICIICRHHSKVDSCRSTALLWYIPEAQWQREIFSVGVNLELCTQLFTGLGRRNGQRCNYVQIHGLWPVVWLVGQGLGRNVIVKLMTDIWGRGLWLDLSEWAKNMKAFVSYVITH